MKHAKLFEQFLFEIGDRSAKPYKYEIIGQIKKLSKVGYKLYIEFTTDSKLEYELRLINYDMLLEVDFFVANLEDRLAETNRGELFKVMATIAEIVKEALIENPKIKGLVYEPKAKIYDRGVDDDMGSQRDKLYRLFINKAAKTMGKKVKFMQRSNEFVVYAFFI